jgi:AcrR family transcriptional regulator
VTTPRKGNEAPPVDPAILDATVAVLAEGGWDRLSLERVAGQAGVSRVTLWRQRITRDGLVDALLARLSADYRDAMWPVLTASGTGRERLESSLGALCGVADRHLDLLSAADDAFHRAWQRSPPAGSFLEPFVRALEDGAADGTLRSLGPAIDAADAVFNTVCWPYVHLRARHGWSQQKARGLILELVLQGVVA